MEKVVILGATGMLGSMVLHTLVKSREFEVIATYRNPKGVKLLKRKYPGVDWRRFDAEKTNPEGIADAIKGGQWAVNAIGITKPYIHDDNAGEIKRAIQVNACFPHLLAQAAQVTNPQVIQIATDCVFSGQKGHYVETDTHDAGDVYGKTKSLGEVRGDNMYHLRCSVIGPELGTPRFLLGWLLGQPKGARVDGFTNHLWNGMTTLHFARICQGVIKTKINLPHVQHLVPGNVISKGDLLKTIAKEFKREDIIINDVEAPHTLDRTLATNNAKLNQEIWRAAGYDTPPTIQAMIKELAKL